MSVVVESKSTERTVYMYFEGWRGAHLSSIVCRAQIFLRKEFCLTDTDTLAEYVRTRYECSARLR